MALAAARDVGIDVRPGVGLPIVALAKERESSSPERSRGGRGAAAGARRRPTPPPPAPEQAGRGWPGRPRTASDGEAAGGRKRDDADAKKPDRVFLPHAKDAIPIRPNSAEMFVLQQLRDEAHRFAVSFHRGQRAPADAALGAVDIPGIGPGRQRQLLRHFGSIKRVREASVDDLAAVPGMTRKVAEAVHAHWAKQPLDAGVVEPQPTAEQAAAEEPHAEEQAIDAAFSDDAGMGNAEAANSKSFNIA